MDYFNRLLILPLGSYEYHGHELPPDTDTIIANNIAKTLAAKQQKDFNGKVSLLPALSYGLSLEHSGSPNTCFVSHTTYYNFMMDLLRSMADTKTLITIVNGHGGNFHTLAALEAEFNSTHSDCKIFTPRLYRPAPIFDLCNELFGELDPHAGSVEASLVAFYEQRPAQEYTVTLPKMLRGSMRFFRTSEVAPHGVIKRIPNVIADPVKGSMVHEAIVKELSESVLTLLDDLSTVLSE